MQDFERIYELLDIHYDIQCGESFYNDRLPGVVDRLLKAGIAEISEGAVVVFFRDDPELADKPLHHSQARWRIQLRHHRCRHDGLSSQRFES